MFPFCTSTEEFVSRLQATETKLLEIARRYSPRPDKTEITTFDTYIPRSSVPCLKPVKTAEEEETLKIHCIRATCRHPVGTAANHTNESNTTDLPLVNLHGYMNAGAYLYRNLGGLCGYFSDVYAVDMLGWGLSSRVPWKEIRESDTLESAEDFFVESLEAWRSNNKIEKMVLSGHSFGAYVAVAYCERYPERVENLVLLSPFGVPDPSDPNIQRKLEWMQSSIRGQVFLGIFRTMFDWTTPGAIVRSLTEHRGRSMARSYVDRRLPEITDAEEAETLAELLYLNAVLPPSGEFFLRTLFHNNMLAKEPLVFRVPNLQVRSVSFMYGTTDWMDVSGGMYTEALCHRLSKDVSPASVPDVSVYLVPNAGHLLILENPVVVNACLIGITGGDVRGREMPSRVGRNETQDLDESWLRRAREIRNESIQTIRR